MGTGYTRNDTPNNIADGNVINASDLDGEFDAIQAAFNATTGHSHDGTTGEGPQIGTGGIADNAVTLGTKTSGNYVAAGAVSGVGLSGSASSEGATFTVTSNATSANTASTIVARDASGNFSAGQISGTSFASSGDMTFGDNDKAVFGAGSDLQIYHSGSASFIDDVGTGNLNLRADAAIAFQNSTGTEEFARFISNGAVQLNYDDSIKLSTTATGCDIDGVLTADGLTVDGASVFNQAASDQSGGAAVKANGTAYGTNKSIHAYMNTSSASKSLIYAENGAGSVFNVDGAGDISFYDSTGTTQGFYWDASEVRLGLGTTSPARNLHLYAENSDASVRLQNTANSKVWEINPSIPGVANSGISIVNVTDNTVPLHITNSGNVGIGTASPTADLHISYGSGSGLLVEDTTNSPSVKSVVTSGNTESYFGATSNHPLVFLQNNTERMRIDSTGNLLVGKTTNGIANTGNEFAASGYAYHTRSGGITLYCNRLTSDGGIAQFRKAGVSIGEIGVDGGDNLYLTGQTGNTGGIYMNDAAVSPAYQGVERDAYYDLGKGAARWKNLYLSGQANVGTAVAATQSASVTGSTTLDFSTYQNFILTMTGNITLANPTTEQAGQSGFIILIHSGAARTVSLGTDYETAGAAGLTLSGTSGAVDLVPYVVQSSGNILLGAPQLAFA